MSNKPTVQFGINIDPDAAKMAGSLRLVKQADALGIELFSLQDHPYNRKHAENWTFTTAMLTQTTQIRSLSNVLNTPLRHPALMAKQAITLDLLSNGRVELGLGAGGFTEMIEKFGGRSDVLQKRFSAFKEYLDVLERFIGGDKSAINYRGDYYPIDGILPGPFPTRDIPIWVGGYGDKMLDLIGQRTDGIIASLGFLKLESLPEINAKINAGAEAAGRTPGDIRRGLNLGGSITRDGASSDDKGIVGTASHWAERLTEFATAYDQDTLVLWLGGDDVAWQLDAFANEVIPAVREAVA